MMATCLTWYTCLSNSREGRALKKSAQPGTARWTRCGWMHLRNCATVDSCIGFSSGHDATQLPSSSEHLRPRPSHPAFLLRTPAPTNLPSCLPPQNTCAHDRKKRFRILHCTKRRSTERQVTKRAHALHRAAATAEAAGTERAEAIRRGRELQRAEQDKEGARVIWAKVQALRHGSRWREGRGEAWGTLGRVARGRSSLEPAGVCGGDGKGIMAERSLTAGWG